MAIQQGIHLTTGLPAGDVLSRVDTLLDQVSTQRDQLDPRTRLAWAKLARRVAGRLDALACLLLAEADAAEASLKAVGTPTSSWLTGNGQLSKRESAGLLHRARELGDHPRVGRAAVEGQVSSQQARSITRLLDSLAPQLDDDQRVEAEEFLLGHASHLDADQLAKAAPQVLAQVAPADANELLETRLQRQVEAAHRQRSLRFFRDGASVRFDGSLPRVDAELWLAQLAAHSEAIRRTAIEERDPLATTTTLEQRRADALITMIRVASTEKPGSGTGGARIVVTLDYQALQQGAAGAGLIGDNEHLSAGELRRLCCDAELIPVVLAGPSEILDVGRAHRLVTAPIRTALTLRDGGCVFPGCDTRPGQCEAHHITPWWDGGRTSLDNLVLLCHHHHGLIEPAPYAVRDQWHVRIAPDGLPEFVPPRRYDPIQKPLRHQRHTPVAPGDPPGG